jgi:hypothetical protein
MKTDQPRFNIKGFPMKWFNPIVEETITDGVLFYKKNSDWFTNQILQECKLQFKSLKLPEDTFSCIRVESMLVFDTWMDYTLRQQYESIDSIFENIGYTTLHQTVLMGMYDRILDTDEIGSKYIANLLLQVIYYKQPNVIVKV